VSSLGELLDLLELDPADPALGLAAGGAEGDGAGDGLVTVAQREFPLRVPRSFVARMRRGDPRDPLLLQVLPTAAEMAPAPGFSEDPLAEASASPVPGLLHKYRGRVLLVATGACAVHCRYCFRRHFPYAEHRPWGEGWRPALDHVAADPTVEEVILSGGDPLAVADDKLAWLAAAAAAIPHLRRLRVHTRLPIVVPERVDAGLLGWLGDGASRLRKVVVVHANHPREVDGEVLAALGRLRAAGVTVLNQAVLLRGVNDRVSVLRRLSETLFNAGVMPYYLHLVDRVRGAAHFEVDEATARDLLGGLTRELPGYLVPRLVRELPGVAAKVPVPPVGL
jgi:EF-P beta-lysylation protein EpmB